jgi:asparagine synthase (glutamine-hydrolysing)
LSWPLHAVHFDQHKLLRDIDFGLEYLEHMVWCMDSPRFDLEVFLKHELHRYARTHHPDLKVMLLGQGADEFAGGYSRSHTHPDRSWDTYLSDTVQPAWVEFQEVAQVMAEHPRHGALARAMLQQMAGIEAGSQRLMFMNLQSLQYYNLWHEDRTAASHGTESRVPFLDHRLVELLASIPPAYHADLFWNKRIVREQLARILPFYPVEQPKVPFVLVPDGNTMPAHRVDMVRRCFGAFRSKYLERGSPLQDPQRMIKLHRGVRRKWPFDRAFDAQVDKRTIKLMRMMCIEIFHRQCQPHPPGAPLPRIAKASPLSLLPA